MKKWLSFWPVWGIIILVLLVLLPAFTLRGSLGNIDWPVLFFSGQVKEFSSISHYVWNDKYLLTGLPTPNPSFFGWLFTVVMEKLPFSGEAFSLVSHFLILFL